MSSMSSSLIYIYFVLATKRFGQIQKLDPRLEGSSKSGSVFKLSRAKGMPWDVNRNLISPDTSNRCRTTRNFRKICQYKFVPLLLTRILPQDRILVVTIRAYEYSMDIHRGGIKFRDGNSFFFFFFFFFFFRQRR